jgi:hypothetical protein
VRTSLPDEREQQLVRRFFDDARDVASRAAWLERSAYRAAPDLAEELSRLRRAKVFAVAWPVGSLVEPWDHAGRVQNRETAATCGLVQNPLPVPSLREAWLRGSPRQLQPLHG